MIQVFPSTTFLLHSEWSRNVYSILRLGAELAKFSLGEAFHCGNLQLRFTRLKHFFMSVRKDKICIHFLFLSLFSFSTDLCIISDILSASCRVTGMENVVCFPPSPFMPWMKAALSVRQDFQFSFLWAVTAIILSRNWEGDTPSSCLASCSWI